MKLLLNIYTPCFPINFTVYRLHNLKKEFIIILFLSNVDTDQLAVDDDHIVFPSLDLSILRMKSPHLNPQDKGVSLKIYFSSPEPGELL